MFCYFNFFYHDLLFFILSLRDHKVIDLYNYTLIASDFYLNVSRNITTSCSEYHATRKVFFFLKTRLNSGLHPIRSQPFLTT